MNDKCKYFISVTGFGKNEVSKEEYIHFERICDFYSKVKGEPATSSFGIMRDGIEISGHIVRVAQKIVDNEKKDK
ncbi:hypothetical protein UFOVP844_38 [uncultured Caudovirales phage]|uniref:Uncharacterized protein n=1 Tax=uncultured Caudovirales phage TaxID=2100421 RepID=A0A6J5P693_9CAUD|nr:hypothetical protein UFOVP844_38 [uncultured Caudovirales phage]